MKAIKDLKELINELDEFKKENVTSVSIICDQQNIKIMPDKEGLKTILIKVTLY